MTAMSPVPGEDRVRARRRPPAPRPEAGWDAEYARDTWRLRRLGIECEDRATIRFGGIPQPWLKTLAKRWARWRLATGLHPATAESGTKAIARFGEFLAAAGVGRLARVDRQLLERYLADLRADRLGTVTHSKRIGQLNAFFTAIRRHGWDVTLPTTALFFPEDYPERAERLPRALTELVMTQLEHPDNLDRWNHPAYRLITVILMRCGLRITDATGLPRDCIAHDGDGAPYLRYFNHKMKREALVPIDEELQRQITGQQAAGQEQWPGGAPLLFPSPQPQLRGDKPVSTSGYRRSLRRWLKRCDIRDDHGRPVHLTPHQWRHTLGTRLINRDVPQEVVRRILDHDSHQMTSHYARLSDTTIRRHWEQARKVNISGETITLDPGGPLAEAAWAKQRLGRVTQALPNGYCGLPVQQSCPHANACLSCPMFITTAEFLPQHHQHRCQVIQIISRAEARGQQRLAEMNQQILGNLNRIITALGQETTDAS
jgi:integrase